MAGHGHTLQKQHVSLRDSRLMVSGWAYCGWMQTKHFGAESAGWGVALFILFLDLPEVSPHNCVALGEYRSPDTTICCQLLLLKGPLLPCYDCRQERQRAYVCVRMHIVWDFVPAHLVALPHFRPSPGVPNEAPGKLSRAFGSTKPLHSNSISKPCLEGCVALEVPLLATSSRGLSSPTWAIRLGQQDLILARVPKTDLHKT